jgi:hypothetical protein
MVNASAAMNMYGPASKGRGAERLDLRAEVFGHHRHLGLRQSRDAELVDQLLHPAGRHAEQVGGGDDRDKGSFGPLAPLEQPVGKV